MKIRHSVLALVACTVALAWGSSATAQERNYWKHSQGHFENTTGNTWVEKAPDGKTYRFVEVERTDKRIELYDRSRACRVHLYAGTCWVKFGTDEWEKYYNGRWGK